MGFLKTQAVGSKKQPTKQKKPNPNKLERDINPNFQLRKKFKTFNSLNVILATYDTYMGCQGILPAPGAYLPVVCTHQTQELGGSTGIASCSEIWTKERQG